MNPPIQAVLFDLGDTLMYSLKPWQPVFELAGRQLSNALCASHLEIDCDTFHFDFLQRLEQYYAERDHNLVETSTMQLLKQLLTEKGYPDLPETLLRPILDQFYAVTQQNWALEADTIPTLAQLRKSGVQLGLVSNAGDTRDVFQLVEKFGIEHYFDFILTSTECGYRKPHPRIFAMALAHWDYLPDEIAMVGDKLEADIQGARPLGIFTIWITRRAKKGGPQLAEPDYTVNSLDEILPLLLTPFKPGST